MQYRNIVKRKLINMIAEPDLITDLAFEILDNRVRGKRLNNPVKAKNYLKLRLSKRDKEYFTVVFLDNHHRVIEIEDMFSGTINEALIYPREVMKAVLKHNAATVLLSHNHPGGMSYASEADKQITRKLTQALALFDVTVVDHVIIGDGKPFSMAEHGYM